MLTLWLRDLLQVVNRDVSIAKLRYFGKEREKEKAAGAKSYKKVKGGVMPAALSAGLKEVCVACCSLPKEVHFYLELFESLSHST